MTVIGSTIVSNSAIGGGEGAGRGGGIDSSGTLTVSNSTISGNRATGGIAARGAGIGASGTLRISHSTIYDNHATGGFPVYTVGGGIAGGGSTFDLRNTIVAGNTAPGGPDLSGALTSSGYNLIGIPSGGSGYASTDLLDVDPRLGPLQDNGGPTPTHALLPGSPALDAGDNASAPEVDQRGLPRVVAGRIDIGAFEVQVGPAALFLLWPVTATETSGVPVDLWVVVLDGYGHVVTDYAGEVFFFSTDSSATLPASYTFRPEDGGVARLEGAVTFRTPGPQLLLAADAAFTALGLALFEVV